MCVKNIPIPGIAIPIRLNTTALIPWNAAFFELASSELFSSSTNETPFCSSLFNKKKND